MSRSTRDFWITAFLGVTLCLVAIYLDAFEQFASLAKVHERWQLDEIATALVFVGLGALVFSYRRTSDLRVAREAAQKLARTDELTGLSNRRGFLEHLQTWKIRLREKECCAVLLIDLDDFKPMNDLYGHRLGDEILRVAASRIKATVGGRALVARIGGDEFGVLLPVASDQEAPTEAPTRIAQSLIKVIREPINLAALTLNVGASIGVATFTAEDDSANVLTTQDGGPVDTVLRRADMALYRVKKSRRNL